jgi:hypothetical protein
MSRFDDRVHQIEAEIKVARIRDLVQALTTEQSSAAEAGAPAVLDRTERVLDHVLVVVGSSDPLLVAAPAAQQLATGLDGISNALKNFAETNDAAHIQTLDQTVEDVAAHLGEWPCAVDTAAISAAATSYRRSAGKQMATLRDELKTSLAGAKENEAKLQELAERIAAESTSLANSVDEAKAALTEVVDNQRNQALANLAELQAGIDTQKAHVDEVVSTFQKNSIELQEKRSEQFQAALTEMRGQHDELEKRMLDDTEGLVGEISQLKDDAVALVGVISATGTASAFNKEAQAQKKIADFWRWAAVAAGVLAAGFAVFLVVAKITTNTDSTHLVTRILGTIALTGVAGYGASQSARHRHREERAKRLELELVAFGPFVESLDDNRKQDARVALAAKLFGQDDSPHGNEPVLSEDSITLFGRLIDQVLKLVKPSVGGP